MERCDCNDRYNKNQFQSKDPQSFYGEQRRRASPPGPETTDETSFRTLPERPRAQVVVPPNSCNPNERTVIEFESMDPRSRFIVPPVNLNDDGNGRPFSQITLDTPNQAGPSGRSQQPYPCLRPRDCPRMQSLAAPDDEMDKIELERTIADVMDTYQASRTIDDAEECLEIQCCQDISSRLGRLMEDKRARLRERQERRSTELLQRKMDFHRTVIQRIHGDRLEQSRTHNLILSMLNELGNDTNKSRRNNNDELEISISANDIGEYSRFRPQAESTRIENGNGYPLPGTSRTHNIKVKLPGINRPCTCDEKTGRRPENPYDTK